MEQRAPRTASFASVVATMSFIALLANAFLGKYPDREGQRVLLKPLLVDLFQVRRTITGPLQDGHNRNGFGF